MGSCNRLALVVLPWRQRFSFHLNINVQMSLVKMLLKMSAQEQRGVFLVISLACYPLRDCLMSSRDCVMELTVNSTGHFRDSSFVQHWTRSKKYSESIPENFMERQRNVNRQNHDRYSVMMNYKALSE